MKYFLFSLVIIFGCQNPFQNEQDRLSNDPIWVEIASAERQCIVPDFASLEEAISQLKDNNILVLRSRELSIIVCRACSCPTGIVYQAEIRGTSLPIARNLGWEVVDESHNLD